MIRRRLSLRHARPSILASGGTKNIGEAQGPLDPVSFLGPVQRRCKMQALSDRMIAFCGLRPLVGGLRDGERGSFLTPPPPTCRPQHREARRRHREARRRHREGRCGARLGPYDSGMALLRMLSREPRAKSEVRCGGLRR